MVKWEYRVEIIAAGQENLQNWLNQYGNDGWELVDLEQPEGTKGFRLTFKRPKE